MYRIINSTNKNYPLIRANYVCRVKHTGSLIPVSGISISKMVVFSTTDDTSRTITTTVNNKNIVVYRINVTTYWNSK